ncbi:MAG: hypothetical protein GY862_37630, partial [Gammaproteobacteria bacterium]|nr:hypothetical protein [Gammaproteobacteria bacterium]
MLLQNKKAAFGVALVVSLTFISYSEALHNDFQIFWDTDRLVSLNPHIRSFSLDNLYWMLTETYIDHWHPLTWFSHALDYALFGLEPWGHHFSSILLHCMNTVWLFALVIMLLWVLAKKSSAGKFQMDTRVLAGAGIAALLFGIHPQHVESVAWVAERKDVLSLFFIMPVLLAYLRYASAPSAKSRTRWYLLALFCFCLAILAKSMAVTIPAILILMDIYPLKRIVPGANHFFANAKVILEKIPFFLLSLVSIILTVAGQ